MLYRILNLFLEKSIDKKRSIVRRYLENDLERWQKTLAEIHDGKDRIIKMVYGGSLRDVEKTIETIKQRQGVDREYVLLVDHFKQDQKRRFMVNSNFSKYLDAVEYLYLKSDVSISSGVLMAPAEIYHSINAVQESFKELMRTFNIKG